jgi:hypothetical protein
MRLSVVGERRVIIIRSARRDVCARVLPPAPFPTKEGGRRNGRQGRVPVRPASPVLSGERRVIALTTSQRRSNVFSHERYGKPVFRPPKAKGRVRRGEQSVGGTMEMLRRDARLNRSPSRLLRPRVGRGGGGGGQVERVRRGVRLLTAEPPPRTHGRLIVFHLRRAKEIVRRLCRFQTEARITRYPWPVDTNDV